MKVAAGVTAVIKSMQFSWSEGGVNRGTRGLLKMNQKDGFDCSSCAWPDPDDHRSVAEFCENGAKATASDADDKAAGPEFFAQHSLAELSRMTDRDQNNAGRLTHPMVKRPGDNHYKPIAWPEAFQIIADELNALDSPDEAVFYTSGKVPNEPAFLFQLFVRAVRHQQPARLLQHVPREQRLGPQPHAGPGQRLRHAQRHSRGRGHSRSSARTPAPTTRACSRLCKRPSATAPKSSA